MGFSAATNFFCFPNLPIKDEAGIFISRMLDYYIYRRYLLQSSINFGNENLGKLS